MMTREADAGGDYTRDAIAVRTAATSTTSPTLATASIPPLTVAPAPSYSPPAPAPDSTLTGTAQVGARPLPGGGMILADHTYVPPPPVAPAPVPVVRPTVPVIAPTPPAPPAAPAPVLPLPPLGTAAPTATATRSAGIVFASGGGEDPVFLGASMADRDGSAPVTAAPEKKGTALLWIGAIAAVIQALK